MNALNKAAEAARATIAAARTNRPHPGDTRSLAADADRYARAVAESQRAGNVTMQDAMQAATHARDAAHAHDAVRMAWEALTAADKGWPGVCKNHASDLARLARRVAGTAAAEAVTDLAMLAAREVARAKDVQRTRRNAAARNARACAKALLAA